jgi:hypothetical protein
MSEIGRAIALARGTTTDPSDALAELLRADGIDSRQLPDNVDARAVLCR